MNPTEPNTVSLTTRREFLKTSTKAVAGAALLSAVSRPGYTAESNTLQIALIGCGGRGTGAAADALSDKSGPIKLVAMADVFSDRLKGSYAEIKKNFKDQVDVPEDRQFVGFDAYKKAMDCLKPGDIAIFATPPGFRWVHFTYAVEKGLNVFMEKPVTVDGPSTRKMLKLAEDAKAKNLKVGVGLMCRHSTARAELLTRIKDGQMGDIIMLRAYRMHGPVGSAFTSPKTENDKMSELLWQIQHFHSFLWASGGCYSDFYIHHIDECCWMKDAWPIKAQAIAGRHYRGDCIDQNMDNYSVEYTFADGAKMFLEGRTMTGCHEEFASLAHGSKGSAIISNNGHYPAPCRIFKGQNFVDQDIVWKFPGNEPNPYRTEWNHLIDAIRNDKPYNEVVRGATASLVTSMGRMAAHTGEIITYDQILNAPQEFAPGIMDFTMNSAAPVLADAKGQYPIPQPGKVTDREY
jgi:predicted dehydrogenase